MKYNYMNYLRSKKRDDHLGYGGCFGEKAKTPEEALAHAIDQAHKSRKLMGFPIDIVVKLEFRLEL